MKTEQPFDPILGAVLLPVLGAAPASRAPGRQTASVFVGAALGTQQPAAYLGAAPSLRDRLRRRFWHYEVDMTHHPVVMRFVLPAMEEAFAFSATVTMLWAVQDPVEVALLGVRDLKPVLWTFLDQALRCVSRQYGIEDVQAAEAEMRLTLEKQAAEIGFGLRLPMLAVSLRLDEDTERYLSERVHTDRAGTMAGDRHELARRTAEFEEQRAGWRSRLEQTQAEWRGRLEHAQAMHTRQLEQAQAVHARELEQAQETHARQLENGRAESAREIEEAQARHTRRLEEAQAAHRQQIDRAQAAHTREIDKLNTEHETNLKRQRLSFYREALRGDHHELIILQLIDNPGDIGAVLHLIDNSDKYYDRSRQVLTDLLENRLANASDVEDLTRHTIAQLQSALSAAAPRSTLEMKEGVTERVHTEVRETHADRTFKATTM